MTSLLHTIPDHQVPTTSAEQQSADDTLPMALERLRHLATRGGRVLSAFLDTAPERMANQAYLLALRDGCKALRTTLPDMERAAFERAVAQVEEALSRGAPHAPGVALYAVPDRTAALVVPLPARPLDHVVWDATPVLDVLQEMLDEYERVAVLLVDKCRARLVSIFLGRIEHEQRFEDFVPGKHESGGWSALAQSRYARHHEAMVSRHIHHAIEALRAMQRTHPFTRLLIGGPDEALAALRHHLPRSLRRLLAGSVELELFADDEAVLRAALHAAAEAEHEDERQMIAELCDAAGTPHTATGVDDTLAALNERRAALVFVADTFHRQGSECAACQRLLAGVLPVCPVCGGPATVVDDLRERILASAWAQDARLETVSGVAADMLLACGGVGAWTRY